MSQHRTGMLAAGAVLAATASLAGCTPPAPQQHGDPGDTATATVLDKVFVVEVRDSDLGRAQGLSGRAEVPPGTGMLFRYDQAAPRHFWMSQMVVPIDLAWIADGVLLEVQTLQPCVAAEACPVHRSPGPVDSVLEVAAGELAGIPPGSPVVIDPR